MQDLAAPRELRIACATSLGQPRQRQAVSSLIEAPRANSRTSFGEQSKPAFKDPDRVDDNRVIAEFAADLLGLAARPR